MSDVVTDTISTHPHLWVSYHIITSVCSLLLQGPRSACFCFGASSRVTEVLFAHLQEKQAINTPSPSTHSQWLTKIGVEIPQLLLHLRGVALRHLPKKPLPFEFLARCVCTSGVTQTVKQGGKYCGIRIIGKRIGRLWQTFSVRRLRKAVLVGNEGYLRKGLEGRKMCGYGGGEGCCRRRVRRT